MKKARLTYTRLTSGECDPALVRIRLYTGRSHQIRVQFASRKHPLVGDHKYGAKDSRGPAGKHTAPMLYSCCITLPWKGRELRFEHLPDWADAARLDRIAAMEAAFDRHQPDDMPALIAYLDDEWKSDYEADEQGLIPRCMKRGILSQDGLYDLVTAWEADSRS